MESGNVPKDEDLTDAIIVLKWLFRCKTNGEFDWIS